MIFYAKVALATGILIWAVVEDLRSRKFSNRSFIVATSLAFLTTIAAVAYGGDFSQLIPAFMGFGAGIVLFLPLVLMGIVGAGDMKLMAAFGILAGWEAVLWTGVYGIAWGAVFGVVQIISRGTTRTLVQNITTLAATRSKEGVQLHRIPFTAPLLLGWMSYLVLTGVFR